MDVHAIAIGVSILLGSAARLSMLRVDYRQYPSYPQSYIVHLTLGGVAAFLGAVAVPAVLTEDYAAGTFLALAATQFREVRSIERETLRNIENTELVPRGSAYIEGIARVFEARNYLAMVTALLATLAFFPAHSYSKSVGIAIGAAVIVGIASILLLKQAMQGPSLKDIAQFEFIDISFDGATMIVDDNPIMNVGTEEARDKYLEMGLAVIITPNNPDAKATLANMGQRQAIVHTASALLGIRMDVDTPEYTPIIRRHIDTGVLYVVMIPTEVKRDAFIRAISSTPILEGSVRKPLESTAAKMVD